MEIIRDKKIQITELIYHLVDGYYLDESNRFISYCYYEYGKWFIQHGCCRRYHDGDLTNVFFAYSGKLTGYDCMHSYSGFSHRTTLSNSYANFYTI